MRHCCGHARYVESCYGCSALNTVADAYKPESEVESLRAKLAKAKEALKELSECDAGGRPSHDHIDGIKEMATIAAAALREIGE